MKGSVVTREQKIKQKKERFWFWFWVLLVEFTQKSTKDFASFFLLPLLLPLLHLLYLTIVSCPSLPFAIRSMFFDLSHATLLVFFSYCTFSTFCLIPSILHSRLGMALDVYSLVYVRICFNMSTNIPLDSPTRLVCQTVFLGFFRWCCC
jgi:hypothetical protein